MHCNAEITFDIPVFSLSNNFFEIPMKSLIELPFSDPGKIGQIGFSELFHRKSIFLKNGNES